MDRIEKIESMLGDYYESEDSFEQTDLAISLIQGHMGWLVNKAKKTEALQNTLKDWEEERCVLLNRVEQLEQEKDFLYNTLNKIQDEVKSKMQIIKSKH